MKLTREQKKKLSDVFVGVATDEEISELMKHDSEKEFRGQLLELLGQVALSNRENRTSIEKLETKFSEIAGLLLEGTMNSSARNERALGKFTERMLEGLTGKLDEVKTHLTPKEVSMGGVSEALADIKGVLLATLVTLAAETKRFKTASQSWYGSGGMDWNFVRLSGTINGTNKEFTIPSGQSLPRSDSIVLMWHNGAFKQANEGDFTRDGGTFTMTTAPRVGMQVPAVLYEK